MSIFRLICIVLFLSVLLPTLAVEKMDSLRVESLRQLKLRSDNGDPKALYDMAYLYDTGYADIPVDTALSTKYYTLSADAGYAPAQNYLGFRYYRGEGVERDPLHAVELITRAAEQGDPKGANNLGWLLIEGEGVVHDYTKAAYWLSKAAEAGLPAGISQLADLYKKGLGVDADSLKAACLYERAIECGLADAELKLSEMLSLSIKNMTETEAITEGLRYRSIGAYRIAAQCYETAAGQGNAHGKALLADACSRGEGVDYDYDRAVKLYYEAALDGNPSAQFVIGELLEILRDAIPEENAPEIYSVPDYWYALARIGGVSDAASATDLLYSVP